TRPTEILESCDRGPSPYKTRIYTSQDAKNYSDINRGATLNVGGKLKNMYHRVLIKRKAS
ncbi:MAG: hypothetical protein II177_08020, partial [Lachnospiraceae bacterium]|nr:hypothetical protein [Lachnospiraceae bacterium]